MGVQRCNSDGQSFGFCMGCGGNDTGAQNGDGEASDGAAVGDDAAGQEGGLQEGGVHCDPPDGGAPCDPGSVPCGGKDCPTSTSFCCETATGSSGTCDMNGAFCTQSSVHCNESADCDGGVCCMTLSIGFTTTVTSTCRASCPTGTYQLCHSNNECGSGKPCIVQTCVSGNETEACSTVPTCTPK
jgi:hypothetical protein